jgi:preprotein translocase subunit SecE
VAQHENAPNKPVHLMFLVGGVALFYLLQWSIDWIWGYFVRSPDELITTSVAFFGALVTGIVLYRNDRVHGLASEVSAELKKVTWPTAKEVRAATIVVIAMALLSAIVLGLFDLVWAQVTELVYGA